MTPTQETPRNPLSRRTLLGTAAAVVLAPVALTAGAASAAPTPSDGQAAASLPQKIRLPVGIRPEGITSGPGLTYYVGSLADGRIVTGSLRTGSVATLLAGATGRSLRGLFWDRRTKLVWAVGNVGAVSHVWAVDDTTGAVVSDTVVPGAVFLNDLVVTSRAVWVTDSQVDRITVVALGAGGAPSSSPAAFLPLSGAWPAGDGVALNANGIRQLPDGSIILNNSRVGGLWQVDPTTGVTTAIPVTGGPGISSGDGLELDGSIVYNVRGTGTSAVSVLKLRRTRSGWAANWRTSRSDKTLDVPSTATLAGGYLWAVNARFGVASPGTASYWISRLYAN